MSDLGEYLRLTDEELARIQVDHVWAWDHMEDVREGEEHVEPGPADGLYYASDMAWPLLRVLLGRAGFPVDVSRGEQRIRYADPGEGDYGYLTADQVGVAARGLADLPVDRLMAYVEPGDVVGAGLCPPVWDEAQALKVTRLVYGELVEYFGAAAREGHALLVWQL
ncbi:DUF1877 family protein [Streptomyces sp. MB09-02B]|uniref:DUF1877 family protein n=1 Tax=Streptomyces sp. MB09-02B TaxID=3028667 RepID=UPI0029A95030|nr:DUF1877 family protein [Streptomyces sp. MB09-02B]MDX3645111.1 DUF1877 family protein [Streptomyces sp. MB09-02B]